MENLRHRELRKWPKFIWLVGIELGFEPVLLPHILLESGSANKPVHGKVL